MGYCTADDVILQETHYKDYFPGISGDAAIKVKIEEIITSQSDFINGIISQRYTLPLTAYGILTQICIIMTRYIMMNSKSKITKEMRIDYDNSLLILDEIATGKRKLNATVSREDTFTTIIPTDVSEVEE